MGYSTYSADDWDRYTKASSYDTKSTDDIFRSRVMDKGLDPKGVIRESCDSDNNPASTPIIVGLDVTGSMGRVLDSCVRHGLKTLFEQINERKPVSDPHIAACGIGDCHVGDPDPFQVTQFETDLRILEQTEKIRLVRGGGANGFESYPLAWYFAAYRTKCDAILKRGQKGYLFTVGDEPCAPDLKPKHILDIFGDHVEAAVKAEDLLTIASRSWEIFHLTLEEGNHSGISLDEVQRGWTNLLGQRALLVADHKNIAEVIISAIQVVEGARPADVARSWGGNTSMVVHRAVSGLTPRTHGDANGLVAL